MSIRAPRLRTYRSIKKALEEDRKELEAFFEKSGVYPTSQIAEIEIAFKRAHKAVYSLCLWSHEFSDFPIHQKVFLEELRSDVLQSFPMALLGFKKPVALLLRSAIEDLLRHIYYFDHKIEFEKLEKKPSSYELMNDLWQYARKHPRLEKIFEKSNVIASLENDYAVFSRFVHSTSTFHMNLTKSMSEIGFDVEFFEKYGSNVSTLAKRIHFVLFTFCCKSIEGFNPPWTSFLLDILSKQYRKLL